MASWHLNDPLMHTNINPKINTKQVKLAYVDISPDSRSMDCAVLLVKD